MELACPATGGSVLNHGAQVNAGRLEFGAVADAVGVEIGMQQPGDVRGGHRIVHDATAIAPPGGDIVPGHPQAALHLRSIEQNAAVCQRNPRPDLELLGVLAVLDHRDDAGMTHLVIEKRAQFAVMVHDHVVDNAHRLALVAGVVRPDHVEAETGPVAFEHRYELLQQVAMKHRNHQLDEIGPPHDESVIVEGDVMVVRTVQCQRRLRQFQIVPADLLEQARYVFRGCRYVVVRDPEVLIGIDQSRICSEQIEDSAPLAAGGVMGVLRTLLQFIGHAFIGTHCEVPR